MKKKICVILALLAAMSASVHAEDVSVLHENVIVIKDGVTMEGTVNVLEEDGVVLAPMRTVFDLMNAKLTWDGMRKQIRTSVMGNIILSIGSKRVMTGGNNGTASYVLETYPRVFRDATMVPTSFLKDALGCKVNYASNSNSLVIVTD